MVVAELSLKCENSPRMRSYMTAVAKVTLSIGRLPGNSVQWRSTTFALGRLKYKSWQVIKLL